MKIFLEKPYLLALVITAALAIWLISGQTAPPEPSAPPKPTPGETKATSIEVQVRVQQPERLPREIVLTGHTAPLRTVTLRAEIEAKVIAVGAARGARVTMGEVIAQLATEDRELRLKEAQALVAQRELEYAAKKSLQQKGYQAQTQMAEAQTLLESAKTMVEQAQLALANTVIRAPFDGVLTQRLVEQGDYVSKGNSVAEIMDEDPFLIIADVTELQRSHLQIGAVATAHLVTGKTVTGHISLIATRADPATRTFPIEIEVPNPDGEIAAGITTDLRIPIETVTAYKLSAALLSLNDEGVVGVKAVGPDHRVVFYPAKIARATADHIWLIDLPTSLSFITVGQGFVRPGEVVRPNIIRD